MDIIIFLLAVFGLTFLIKEMDGPWGTISSLRNKLMTNKTVGVFFFKLFDCYFCTGWWCSILVYLLWAKELSFNLLICHALAGAIFSIIMNSALVRLYRE